VNGAARADRDRALRLLVERLLARRVGPDRWEGHLASSALATGTAVLALHLSTRAEGTAPALDSFIERGVRWLIDNQNSDGGWGDTVRSRSNISTTAIVWATLAKVGPSTAATALENVTRAESWLRTEAGDVTPAALRSAILQRYGKDHTFSVPILTVLALTGKLGSHTMEAWRSTPQLPFELAALPHSWFQYVQLPVVSYALPALIAMGRVRHAHAPTRNPVTRALRDRVWARTHRVLREMQPESGGYLEATPLTSFVVMSLAGAGHADSPVVIAGIRFLIDSMREDGSWPIDTNLATWVTTRSIDALANAGALPVDDAGAMRQWLLQQQSTREHPFTHAAPGAWAWTPLSGGVPDADDTSGALVALRALGEPDAVTIAAAAAGARWLLGVQNRDGGMPTFCRGWGTLPFDRSTPELTAHALRAWSAWAPYVDILLAGELRTASLRALRFLERAQRSDGAWVPLWFGNEHASDENNPVYGTARVLMGLHAALVADDERSRACADSAHRFLLAAQNPDGGWGGADGVPSSVEETGLALAAIASHGSGTHVVERQRQHAVEQGIQWLAAAVEPTQPAAPIGLYFARLWYYEELYPLIFAVEGLSATGGAQR
jgi:squalene-hopene/tetraprenyl-beta-curcumene cyclase